jgi:hypothetical protein
VRTTCCVKKVINLFLLHCSVVLLTPHPKQVCRSISPASMASCLRIKDYRGLTSLTPEQEQLVAAARAAAAQLQLQNQQQNPTAAAQQLQVPAARLNSGYDIPLVGLGTW